MSQKILRIVFLVFLTGCQVGPVYEPPETCAPEDWKGAYVVDPEPMVFEYWWEVFNDETLNNLESDALANSPTIELALAKVCEARAIAKQVLAAQYPQISINPSYEDTGQLFQFFIPPALKGIAPSIPGSTVFRIHMFQYVLPAVLNYEVDLWGKLRSNYASAVYSLEASEYDLEASLLTLTSELASNYFQMRALDTEIDILRATIILREKELKFNQSRYDKGLVSNLDVSGAEVELANVQASLQDALRQRTLLENMIAALIGEPASSLTLAADPLVIPPPLVPAGLPSDVLLRRPDIAEAESLCASKSALINVAYASFFPSLSLTGTLGFLSPTLKDFLSNISRYWVLGANSSQSVIDGGRNCANVDIALARFQQATANYQQTVVTAFREVEDALTSIELQAKQYEDLERAVTASKKSAGMSMQRYSKGLVNYLEVIQYDRTQLQAEQQLALVLGQRYVSTVNLIKALGGSW